jgi:hypothetical protein
VRAALFFNPERFANERRNAQLQPGKVRAYVAKLNEKLARPGSRRIPRSIESELDRMLRYAGDEDLASHVAYSVEKSLASGSADVAVLARHWSALDAVRCLLDERGVEYLHHRDFHRPIHRRHPAARVIG